MILSVTLNPAVDHILFCEGIKLHDTNRVISMQSDAGGKGVNLSRIAVELGAKSVATGFLGGGSGAFISHALHQQGVATDFVEIAKETRTNLNVEDGDGPPTTFNAKGPQITDQEWEHLKIHVERLSQAANWVALGGSLPPGIPQDAFKTLGQIAKKNDCKVVLDADGEILVAGLEAAPDMIKPNLREAERLLNRSLGDSDHDVLLAVTDLVKIMLDHGSPDPIAVISRGKLGAVLATKTTLLIGRGIPIHACSTIGSGDSLIGGMLFGLETHKSLEESFRFGLAAGAATASTDGTEIGRKDVILDLYEKAEIERASV